MVTDNNPQITTVLFDVTGVLVTRRLRSERLAASFGVDPSDTEFLSLLDKAIWFHRLAHDQGASDEDFWDSVSGDCALPKPTDNLLAELVNEDTHRMTTPDVQAYHIAKQLVENSLSLGILANAPASVAQTIKDAEWSTIFDTMTFSSIIGRTKPDQAIYRAAIDSVNTPPEQVLFIDDRASNLRPAEMLGMQVLEWTSPQDVQNTLIQWNVL